MVWTQFHDMHSGGSQKLEWAQIYIEAPEAEAALIFQNAFGRNPHRVTCMCCGADYLLTESMSLAQASRFQPDVKVIPAAEIRPEWRQGELREEGYVWAG